MPKKHDPKKERKRGNHVPKKRQGMIQERKPLPQGVRHIYPSTHTLAPFDRDCMTCFSIDPLFDFTIYGMQVCPILILPSAPQRLIVVGKIKGKYCPCKEIQVECLKRVILRTLPCFQKSFKKYLQMDCRSLSK